MDEARLTQIESAARRYMAKANTKHAPTCEQVTSEGLELGPCNCGLGELEWLLFGYSDSYKPDNGSSQNG